MESWEESAFLHAKMAGRKKFLLKRETEKSSVGSFPFGLERVKRFPSRNQRE